MLLYYFLFCNVDKNMFIECLSYSDYCFIFLYFVVVLINFIFLFFEKKFVYKFYVFNVMFWYFYVFFCGSGI